MRTFQIALVLILVGIIGYAIDKNPAGCMKIVSDFGALFNSLSPVKLEINNGSATITTGNSTNAAPDTTASTEAAPAGTTPAVSTPAASSGPSPLDSNVSGLVPTLINGNLISANGGAYNFPPAAPLSSIRYFAIYYSAAWCPPCHAFTPELVQWYNGFKPSHPNFELIFVSEDHDENAQFGYMKEMNMPWPGVRYGALKHDGNGTFKGSGIEQFAGNGIPDLVLVDSTGKVLLDSYQNGSYVGPEQVMNGIGGQIGK